MSHNNKKNDKKTSYFCPQCKNHIYEDQRLLELYCPICGLVIKTTDIE